MGTPVKHQYMCSRLVGTQISTPVKANHEAKHDAWGYNRLAAPKFRNGTLNPWVSKVGSLFRQKFSGTSEKEYIVTQDL